MSHNFCGLEIWVGLAQLAHFCGRCSTWPWLKSPGATWRADGLTWRLRGSLTQDCGEWDAGAGLSRASSTYILSHTRSQCPQPFFRVTQVFQRVLQEPGNGSYWSFTAWTWKLAQRCFHRVLPFISHRAVPDSVGSGCSVLHMRRAKDSVANLIPNTFDI